MKIWNKETRRLTLGLKRPRLRAKCQCTHVIGTQAHDNNWHAEKKNY